MLMNQSKLHTVDGETLGMSRPLTPIPSENYRFLSAEYTAAGLMDTPFDDGIASDDFIDFDGFDEDDKLDDYDDCDGYPLGLWHH